MPDFYEFGFMQRALACGVILSLSATPLGVFLLLRRMTLLGEALSHGILPGVAVAYLGWGLCLPAFSIGGIIAGILVLLLSYAIYRYSILEEEASFTGLYLIALALGIFLLSHQKGNINVFNLLFGGILAIDTPTLWFISGVGVITWISLALIYKPLIIDCFDPLFFQSICSKKKLYNGLFLFLVVINLVAAYQALGTLMALGLMMLPALAARLWANHVHLIMGVSIAIGVISSLIGLNLSFYGDWPTGPTIVLVLGGFYGLAFFTHVMKRLKRGSL